MDNVSEKCRLCLKWLARRDNCKVNIFEEEEDGKMSSISSIISEILHIKVPVEGVQIDANIPSL